MSHSPDGCKECNIDVIMQKHGTKLKAKFGIGDDQLKLILKDIFDTVEMIPREAILREIEEAIKYAERIADVKDFNYVFQEHGAFPLSLSELLFHTVKASSLIELMNVWDTGQTIGYQRWGHESMRAYLDSLKAKKGK